MLQTSDGGEVRDDVADALVLLVARLLVPGGHACEAGRAAEVGLDAVFALFASREEVLETGDGLVDRRKGHGYFSCSDHGRRRISILRLYVIIYFVYI